MYVYIEEYTTNTKERLRQQTFASLTKAALLMDLATFAWLVDTPLFVVSWVVTIM
jgi:hypothetical protein